MKKKFYLTKMAALCGGIVLVTSLTFLGGYDCYKIWNEKKEGNIWQLLLSVS